MVWKDRISILDLGQPLKNGHHLSASLADKADSTQIAIETGLKWQGNKSNYQHDPPTPLWAIGWPCNRTLDTNRRHFFPGAKDFPLSRKYAYEDTGNAKGEGVEADNQFCLITALKQHDGSAWSVTVDRHLHEVYGFVFHLVGGDRAVAEDLNQETWLEALDGIEQCDAARGSFRNWLFGIARKRVALYYRRRALAGNPMSFGKGDSPHLPERPTERFAQKGTVSFSDADDIAILPEDVLEQVEQISVIRAAILVLPEDRRKALIWKYVEGHSVDAIAIRMERTAKAVESLLSRARGQLRDLLRGYMMPSGELVPRSPKGTVAFSLTRKLGQSTCKDEGRVSKESSNE